MHSKKVEKVDIQILNANLEARKKILQEQVDEFLKNKDNSLEDRWEVWTKYSQTNNKDWTEFPEEFKEFGEHISDWGWDMTTLEYTDLLEMYEDFLIDEVEVYADNLDSELDKMKEYLMEQNLRSYKFDW